MSAEETVHHLEALYTPHGPTLKDLGGEYRHLDSAGGCGVPQNGNLKALLPRS